VAASTLTRTKYVAPKYPRAAERRNLSGWVDVAFTVTYDGSVIDVDVTGSDPGDTFVDAATRAVSRWRFEPVVENGEIVEKRAGVRMMFAIE
jgi:protein TonB